jgi:hypothetical protein
VAFVRIDVSEEPIVSTIRVLGAIRSTETSVFTIATRCRICLEGTGYEAQGWIHLGQTSWLRLAEVDT